MASSFLQAQHSYIVPRGDGTIVCTCVTTFLSNCKFPELAGNEWCTKINASCVA